MKYATILLGFAILLTSVATAPAGDSAFFICPPGKTKVGVLYWDDNKRGEKDTGYVIFGTTQKSDKWFPFSSRLFRLDQTSPKGDTLYYRGKRCVEEPESSVAAAAEKKWEADCRRGWVESRFTHNAGDPGPGTSFGTNDEVLLWDDKTVSVRLSLEDLLELQKHIRLLKQCEAFHQCLSDRADGKVKHCYENDKRWRALFRDE